MRLWLPTNPLWYIAALILFGPFVIEAVLGPSWIVKLISISFLILGIPLLLFFFALTNKFSPLMEETPFVAKWGKQRVLVGIRVFFLIVALIFSLNGINLAKDIKEVLFDNAPVKMTATVAQKYNGTAPGSFFTSTIRFDNQRPKPDGSFEAWFFPSRFIQVDRTYELLYLPHTHIILEAKPIQ